MSKDKGFYQYILEEVFADIPGITSRSMFGGYGFYKDGLIFAIIAEGKLYFKVGEGNRADYQEWGSEPFVYEAGNHKSTTMSYWDVPEEILEQKDILVEWIDKAVAVHKEKSKKRKN